MQAKQQLISNETRDAITNFVSERVRESRGNEEIGAHGEFPIGDDITLVLDWHYLDAPSSYLCVPVSAQGYDPEQATEVHYINDVSDTMDHVDCELADVLDSDIEILFDESNSTDDMHIWHITGASTDLQF